MMTELETPASRVADVPAKNKVLQTEQSNELKTEETNEIRQLVMAIGSIILISTFWWLVQ